ncbi:MAG: glycosyltransferase [Candidatus Limnocylindrales bacterium]
MTEGRSAALRVVMFVHNDVSRDSRVLREARSLVDAGHQVTIIGRPHSADERSVTRQERDGFSILLVPPPHVWRTWLYRYRKPWRMRGLIARRFRYWLGRGPAGWVRAVAFIGVAIAMVVMSIIRLPFIAISGGRGKSTHNSTLDWLIRFRFGVLGWARTASAAAPRADVYHGHDLTGLPAAVRAADRFGGLVVYDSHEFFVESGSNAGRPAWAKWLLSRLERRLSARATALVTVNRTLGRTLDERLAMTRIVVVHNCPPRWDPPVSPVDPLRPTAGLPPGTPVVLYHGGFTRDRGLLELADAMLEPGLEDAHLVLLGFGPLEADLLARSREPRADGRLHVLPAVPPDQLPDWVAAADVGAMPNQPRTANERLSTPNKLFESLAVGLPVVSSDFPERRSIVVDDPDGPLGALCDPTDIRSIATAIRSILDLDPAARADLRARCLRAAHDRWNWETESAKLVALYASLGDEAAAAEATAGKPAAG